MTLDQFKAQAWTANMRCEYYCAIYPIVGVDFAESLVGLKDPMAENVNEIKWVRCENVNLRPKAKSA